MLDSEEFKSIWDIAFFWEGLQPPQDDPSHLPDGVVRKIEKLIWAFRECQLTLRDPSGQAVYDEKEHLFEIVFLNRTRKLLKKCYKLKSYPKAALDNKFIKRVDLLKWCTEDFTNLPEFWVNGNLKSPSETSQTKQPIGRHINQELDKQLCQSIAQTLWDIDPNIHPAHMAKSWAIVKYGNGRQYKRKDGDYETIKKWIKEVDPKRGQRGDGCPPNISYLIDLESGRLAED